LREGFDGLEVDPSVGDLLLRAETRPQSFSLGVPGIGIMAQGGLPEAAAWLAIADWYGFVPGPAGDVQVAAMTRDNTRVDEVVNASITRQQFSPAAGVECTGRVRLYSSQGSGSFNPARYTDLELDRSRVPGSRSWEVRDQSGVDRERGSRTSYWLEEWSDSGHATYVVELEVVELLDRGDGREEYYDRSLRCMAKRRLLLSELGLKELIVWNADGIVYARFQPDMQSE